MTVQETRDFLKQPGVGDTFVMIFQQIKEAYGRGDKYVSVGFPGHVLASKYSSVLKESGYLSTVMEQEGRTVLVILV